MPDLTITISGGSKTSKDSIVYLLRNALRDHGLDVKVIGSANKMEMSNTEMSARLVSLYGNTILIEDQPSKK